MRADIGSGFCKSRFQKSIDGVSVVGSFMAFEALLVAYLGMNEVRGFFPLPQGVLNISLNLLTRTSWGKFVTRAASYRFMTDIHRPSDMKFIELRQHEQE